jgi:hypothetical protein
MATSAATWLKQHPQVKKTTFKLFGVTKRDVPDVLLGSPRRAIALAKALAKAAATFDPPPRVKEDLAELIQKLTSGAASLDKRARFVKKTVAQLVGLRDPHDMELVLRGALPHAPDKLNRRLIEDLIGHVTSSRRNWLCAICCIVGCLLCGLAGPEGCAFCCIVFCNLCGDAA